MCSDSKKNMSAYADRNPVRIPDVELVKNSRKKCLNPSPKKTQMLSQIMMPVMDGLEAARIIRSSGMEDSSSIPIIAMSANAFQDDIEQSMNAGMNEHITKPIDLKMLINTIHSLVKQKKFNLVVDKSI